ncbi:MAG: SRPBCC family protein [Planctomycetes bacterium]|nr:SRPBCC family protein [Planctomycetota bacterium]
MSCEYRLTCQLWLPLPLEQVFAFFADARNLSRITPAWLNFTMRTSGDIIMRDGTQLEYTLQWMRMPIRWQTRVSLYNPSRQFRDQQIHGPYMKWVHTHRFWPEDQGTVIFDEVLYRLPLGLLGNITHHLLIRRQLMEIFNFRQRVIPKLLLGGQYTQARQIEPVTIYRHG